MALGTTARNIVPAPKVRGAGDEGPSVRPFLRPFVRNNHEPRTTNHSSPSRETRNAQLATLVLPATRRDQAARIWAGLLDQTRPDALTTSWEWVGAWLDAYGDAVPHRFLVATDPAGRPVAIALATTGQDQHRGPLPVRTAHLGTAGEGGQGGVYVEHNRILALPEHRVAALRLFTDRLAKPWGRVDYVVLNGFDPEALDGWDAAGFTLDPHVCRIADLEGVRTSGQPLEKAFGSTIGRKLRKNTRWFTERYGPVASEWITDPARGQAAFTELIDLHQARWVAAGEPGSFASERLVRFHRTLIDALLPIGKVVMIRVTAGDQLVGVSYAFNERGALSHYQWGLMDVGPDDGSLSPGFIVALSLMREGLERGYHEINWLGGDARWKRELSTTSRDLIWAERPVSPWATTVAAAITTKHTLRPIGAILTDTGRSTLARARAFPPLLRSRTDRTDPHAPEGGEADGANLPSPNRRGAGGQGASDDQQPPTDTPSSRETRNAQPGTDV